MSETRMISRNLKPEWHNLAKLPVRMYQTPRGPLMGLFEKEIPRGVRLWAPAWVNQPAASNVIFLPIFPVEMYLDLYWAMTLGSNPVPDLLMEGYTGYLGEFIKGSYKMNPVIISAGIQGEPHQVADPVPTPTAEAPASPSDVVTP